MRLYVFNIYYWDAPLLYIESLQENAKYCVILVFETVIYQSKLTLSSSSLQSKDKASFSSALASFVSSLISKTSKALSLSFSYQRYIN